MFYYQKENKFTIRLEKVTEGPIIFQTKKSMFYYQKESKFTIRLEKLTQGVIIEYLNKKFFKQKKLCLLSDFESLLKGR